ncbi:MAG: low molecular weight phosphatase family protein, partial [Rhodomicrobium sp.]
MNAIRSPMAAAILRFLAGKQIYVKSGGVRAGEMDPFAIAAMDEIGIDIGKHRPVSIEDLEDTSFDLIVTLA